MKLGRHVAITKALREGILKVGAKRASKLDNETEHDEWFSSIGEAPNAELFRLYSKVRGRVLCLRRQSSVLMFVLFQVCHHYLVPLLSQIPLDSSLFKRDTSYSSMAPPDSHEEGGDGVKENIDPLHQDLQVRLRD